MQSSIERINQIIDQLVQAGVNRNGSPKITSVSLVRALGVLKEQVLWEQREAERKRKQ